MNHIGLFEGIGGFSLAAQWAGWETIAWCEINPFGQQVLRHHFPKAIGHEDITKTDFSVYRGQCGIVTGGFPCQPYSEAGKRLGKEDERHLWPEMLRAIREIQPDWVVGENVRGLVNWSGGLVFDEVQADLEAEGYEVLPFVLPACGVNAPHRRDRVWFVAYSKNAYAGRASNAEYSRQQDSQEIRAGLCDELGSDGAIWPSPHPNHPRTIQQLRADRDGPAQRGSGIERKPQPEFGQDGGDGDVADASGPISERSMPTWHGRDGVAGMGGGDATDAISQQHTPRRTSQSAEGIRRGHNVQPEERRCAANRDNGLLGLQRDVADASLLEPQRREQQGSVGSTWAAEAQSRRLGEPIRPGWDEFPTQPPICQRNDGLSFGLADIAFSKWRNESIKALGNAIVPQVAYQIFKSINEYNNQ